MTGEAPDMGQQEGTTQLLSKVHIEVYLSWVRIRHQDQIFDQEKGHLEPKRGTNDEAKTRTRTNLYRHECSFERPSAFRAPQADGCLSTHPTRTRSLREVGAEARVASQQRSLQAKGDQRRFV